jgi:hypothetical protein
LESSSKFQTQIFKLKPNATKFEIKNINMYLFDFAGIALAFKSQKNHGRLQELELSNNDFVRIFS